MIRITVAKFGAAAFGGEGVPSADRTAVAIATANIGCLSHLQSGTDTPVRHWIQLLDEAMAT